MLLTVSQKVILLIKFDLLGELFWSIELNSKSIGPLQSWSERVESSVIEQHGTKSVSRKFPQGHVLSFKRRSKSYSVVFRLNLKPIGCVDPRRAENDGVAQILYVIRIIHQFVYLQVIH